MNLELTRSKELKATRDALEAFLANPSLWPDLLPHRISGAVSAGTLRGHDHSGLPVIEFTMHHQGELLIVKSNAATYAVLLACSVTGSSFDINRRNAGSGKAHMRLTDRDNITVARMIAGLSEGEDVAFLDGNTLNLCHCNVVAGRKNPRTVRNEGDTIIALLAGTTGNWGPFEGDAKDQLADRQSLLSRAFERMWEEREVALRPRAA